MNKTIGDDFQTETKYSRNKSLGGNLDWANKPEIYKSYPSSKTIQLSNQFQEATISFAEVLQKRKSIRSFSTQPLSKVDLAFLLWASTGIQRTEHGYEFRTAPSAGALYPIETYIAANNVEDIEKGRLSLQHKESFVGRNKTWKFWRQISSRSLGPRDVCRRIRCLHLDGCL